MSISLRVAAFVCLVSGCGTVDNPKSDAAVTRKTIGIALTGNGTVTSSPAGIDCGTTCTHEFDAGTSITLTAVADPGYTFMGWLGGTCTGTDPCTFSAIGDVEIRATFVMDDALTVLRDGNGMGTVTSMPAGIDCGTDCTEVAAPGTMFMLAAVPQAGSEFTGWSGGGCTGTGACNVTVDAAVMVTATFTLEKHTLTVVRAGNGTGNVTSTPAGIDCGADCTEDLDHGTQVTLAATPGAGMVFDGWSGGGCTGTGDCTITVTAADTVTATFTRTIHTLAVMKNGNGSGTVTSSPAGITCGADCSEDYGFGSMVTLSASPASTSTFTGWNGGGCMGTAPCVVTIMAATTVTATFTLKQYTLTVTKSGTASGTVTSSPVGINCGTDCSELYNHGTMVTLTATTTSTFVGWSGGGCTGTGTCTTTINAATTVNAQFNTSCVTGGSATFNANGSGSSGSIQTFTVPAGVCAITVDAHGGHGGTVDGGFGARTRGTFNLGGGTSLRIVVGQIGTVNSCGGSGASGGGGGGTFVWDNASPAQPMIAAGGGGGGNTNWTDLNCRKGLDASLTNNGLQGNSAQSAPGGTGGNGGSGTAAAGVGAGGAGWLSRGGDSTFGPNSAKGGETKFSFAGGLGDQGFGPGGDGGFGGGGGATCGCGGGGGYSGGGAGDGNICRSGGGGGGSFNAGTNQVNQISTRAGDGAVIISW